MWQGAAIEVLLDPSFEGNYWTSKEEYEEEGLRLVRKFVSK